MTNMQSMEDFSMPVGLKNVHSVHSLRSTIAAGGIYVNSSSSSDNILVNPGCTMDPITNLILKETCSTATETLLLEEECLEISEQPSFILDTIVLLIASSCNAIIRSGKAM